MKTNKKALSRLSRYREALYLYQSYGTQTFLSCDLAKTLKLTAAQVRKDFSTFGISGKKKVGYDVKSLIARIEEILGKNIEKTAVLCGLGDLGSAMLKEGVLRAANVRIIAAFDDHPDRENCAVPVYPLEQLTDVVKKNDIRYGIIATTNGKAQRYLDHLVMAGVTGILSFSAQELKTPKRCIVGMVNPAQEMQNVIYFVNKLASTRS
jgi:redox-sensing transcriptional repressor